MAQANAANSATGGRDSLGKALRRNLSPARVGLQLRRGFATLRTRGWQALGREIAFRFNLATHRETWRYRADIPLRRELRAQRKHPPGPAPLISVVVPIYNTPPAYLRAMIESVLLQSYQNFELVLADGSSDGLPAEIITAYAKRDPRLRYLRLERNMGISGNTNAGIKAAGGEWIVLLDHDDALQKSALYEVAAAAAATGAELIYSDEVVLDEKLRRLHEFHFKGDYGPDTLRGCNTVTHLCAFTRALMQRAGGGEAAAYDGAQDYEFILRLCEAAKGIHHIPKVLYYWRRHGGSTAQSIAVKPAAVQAGAAAVQGQLDRLGLSGGAEPLPEHPGAYRVHYRLLASPLLSVLIPNCDHIDDLGRCLQALHRFAGYDNMEVLVIDNNSHDPDLPAFYAHIQRQYPNLRVVRYPGPFNFSGINNFGMGLSGGEQLLLLNNDVEISSPDFVPEMLGYSQRPDVGAVGAMLYYPDDTVQHAGLIVGIGGTAGVSHKGHQKGDGGDMYRLATVQNVSAVTGAALMVKRSLYLKTGGLDEKNFGVAFNDVDFCLRLRQMGLWNVFTPFATGIHYESKSRGYDTEGERKRRFDREAAAFREKWSDMLAKGDPFYNPHFTLKTENFAYR